MHLIPHSEACLIEVDSVANKQPASVVAKADSEDLIRKGYLKEEKAESKFSVAAFFSKTIIDRLFDVCIGPSYWYPEVWSAYRVDYYCCCWGKKLVFWSR